MKLVKIVICSIIVGSLFIAFDMLIAIATSPLYALYSDLAVWKTPPNILYGMFFDIVNGFILVGVYKVLYNGIPEVRWKKGVIYGLIVGLFRVIMMAFSTFVMYEIPLILVVTSLITGYIEIIILSIILAIIYEKLGLVEL
ncbi:MAG: hypothetical protein ACFFCD_07510 [Promethearchaeota archaeon]